MRTDLTIENKSEIVEHYRITWRKYHERQTEKT